MITGMVEFWIEYFFVPLYCSIFFVRSRLRIHTVTFWTGFFLCLCGGLLRAVGEIQLGRNFAHRIRVQKSEEHELITTGLYSFVLLLTIISSIFRHPAYTGWFYFSIGTQVLLNNPFCIVAYTLASWYFFYKRIPYEESLLLSFFPEYRNYRERTHIFIPFIPQVENWLCLFILILE